MDLWRVFIISYEEEEEVGEAAGEDVEAVGEVDARPINMSRVESRSSAADFKRKELRIVRVRELAWMVKLDVRGAKRRVTSRRHDEREETNSIVERVVGFVAVEDLGL